MSASSEIITHVLSNNLTVLLWPNDYSKSVAAVLSVGAGSRHEDADSRGVAHYLEHIISNKTNLWHEKMDLWRLTESQGMYRNAFTSSSTTGYWFESQPEQLDAVLTYLQQIVFHTQLDEDAVEKERGIILEEWKGGFDDPSGFADDLVTELKFKDHPLAVSIIGTKESITSMNLEKINRFYRQQYVPSNMVLTVVGGFDAAALIPQIEAMFGSFPDSSSAPKTGFTFSQTEPRFIAGERPSEYPIVRLDLVMPGITSPDWYALQLLYAMMTVGDASLFEHQLIDETHLLHTYSFGWFANDDVASAQMELVTSPELLRKALTRIFTIQNELKEGKHAEQLSRAQALLKTSVAISSQDLSSKADGLSRVYHLLGKVVTNDEVFEQIDAVTMNDITSVAQKYLISERVSMAYVWEKELDLSMFAEQVKLLT